jgi:hypothetical protein
MSNETITLPHIIIARGEAKPRIIKRKDGTQVVFNEQSAAIVKGEDFPQPFTLNLGDERKPFPPGRYLLCASSLNVGDFNALKIGRNVDLIPFSALGLK